MSRTTLYCNVQLKGSGYFIETMPYLTFSLSI